MNLRDLRYLIAVDELGHFGRAAAACHISQPTLSGQILKLEQELGISIFERVGKSVRATDAGGQIIAHARRAVAAADDLLACAEASRDPLIGPLRLGVIPTLGPYLMPFMLPQAKQKFPSMPLMLVEDLTHRLLEPVLTGKLDAAIIASDPEMPGLKCDMLFDEPFWLVVGDSHPLASKPEIVATDIDPRTLLLLTDGHCLRDQALDLCGHPELGGSAMADMRAASLETLLHMTAAGYGITLIPSLALAEKRALPGKLVARPLSGPNMARRVRLISRPTNPRRPALDALVRLIQTSVPETLMSREPDAAAKHD